MTGDWFFLQLVARSPCHSGVAVSLPFRSGRGIAQCPSIKQAGCKRKGQIQGVSTHSLPLMLAAAVNHNASLHQHMQWRAFTLEAVKDFADKRPCPDSVSAALIAREQCLLVSFIKVKVVALLSVASVISHFVGLLLYDHSSWSILQKSCALFCPHVSVCRSKHAPDGL